MASHNLDPSQIPDLAKASSQRRILVAIPAYNCSAQIGRVLRQFNSAVAPMFAEVVVIDNRSKDDTAAVAIAEIAKGKLPMSVLRNQENYSLGGTHKVAFARCLEKGFDGVVILHGDDQGQIADFGDLHQQIDRTAADCILGARFAKGSRVTGYSAFRMFGNHVFNTIYSLCVRQPVHDMGSGLNYYSRSLIETGIHHKMPDDLTFNNCMLLATYSAERKVVFQPITWREDDQISNAKLVSQSRRLLQYLAIYLMNRKALLTRDFRDTPRSAYPSDELANNNQQLESRP